VNELPEVTITPAGPFCIDADPVQLVANVQGGTWSGDADENGMFDPSGGTGSATYTYSDGNGCENSDTIEITVNDLPVVTITPAGPFCIDANPAQLMVNQEGGTWSGDVDENGMFDPSGGSGSATYTYSDGNGCENSDTIDIVVNPLPEAMINSEDTVLTCEVQSIALDASGSTVQGEASYLWSTGAVSSVLNVTEPGTYTVTVTDSNGGCSDSTEITITQNAVAVVAIVSGNLELSCQVASTQLDASGSTVAGTASYLWSTGEDTPIIEVTEAGNYTVTVTDTESGCSNATVVEVIFDTSNPDEIDGESTDLCVSEIETLNLTSLLPSGYVAGGTWSDDSNSGGDISGDVLDLLSVNITEENDPDYEFTYTEPGDCGRKITVFVRVNDDCRVEACESPDNITISKVVTVNNDGVNDVFEVSDVQSCGFIVDVKIFNRWGKIVFESDNYQNNWRGRHNGSGPTLGSNSKLPTGTYYYVVNIVNSGYPVRTGYIYLGNN
jgi:gliding motility-associated-like protein